MVTLAKARRLALSFPEATEEDHHGMASFRLGNKIFATVPDEEHLRVMLDSYTTEAALSENPAAFERHQPRRFFPVFIWGPPS